MAESLQRLGEAAPQQRHLLIIANGINFIDAAGAETLIAEARRRRRLGGDLYLSGLKEKVRDFLARAGVLDELGEDHVFASKYEALAQIFERIDKSVCAGCSRRVFLECQILQRRSRKQPGDAETPAAA